jgi:Double-GTPase 1
VEKPRSVLLIGVRNAGKTNFLSRLWLALDSGRGLLAKNGNPTDIEYLANGADYLLKGEFAPRTPPDVRDATEIPVKTTSDGRPFPGKLVVPDLPGEQVLSIFQNRHWSTEWENRIDSGCGCLLFVRVDSPELVAPLDWLNCHHLLGAPLPATQQEDGGEKPKPPTQVVFVDWLQFLRKAFTERVHGAYKPKVGIVVAAWDLAPNDQKEAGPASWIAANLPMLAQYVEANNDDFDFAYFGVSVTSGDLNADEEFKKTYLEGNPRNAGEVTHSLNGRVETSTDMTLPVAWALGLADATASGSAQKK